MKKQAATVTVLVALAASCFAPAQAAGFAAKESWTHGAEGVNKFISSQDCTFIEDHAQLIGYVPGTTYENAETILTKNNFVRDYMSGRIDEGAGEHANMIPGDVREKLIDLGIAGTLKKVSDCRLIEDPENNADKEYKRQLAAGNEQYSDVTVTGVLEETPSLLSSLMGSSGSSES